MRAGKTVARSRIAKGGRVTFASKSRFKRGNYTVVAGKTAFRAKLR